MRNRNRKKIDKAVAKARCSLNKAKSQQESESDMPKRQIFDHRTQTFNFANMRGTDLPFNKRITLPRSLDIDSEIKLRTLGTSLKNAINTAAGTRIESNLSRQQQAGLKSLQERVKNHEIVVFLTDKSGRFSVDTPTNYLAAGEQHTANDETITKKECRDIEGVMNAHSNAWIRMLGAGTLQNDQKRISDDMVSKNCPPPAFYTLRKDHKLAIVEPEIGPPTRPVCGATQAPNKRLSYVMNLIVSEISKNDDDSICLSTEEMLAEIDRVNLSNSGNPIVIGSTDVKALYPSLDIDFTISKVCEVIFESSLKFEGLWYDEIALYVAIHKSPEELRMLQIEEVCPTRTTNRGTKPTVKSITHGEREKRFKNWVDAIREPDDNERRKLLVTALEIGMKHVMKNHTYNFANTIKRQTKGGPIGLDLTGGIAQVFMIWWNGELRRKLVQIGVVVHMKKCYVDDVNYGLLPTPPGATYVNGELHIEEAMVVQDSAVPADERTMKIVTAVGNSIHESTQLEYDCPSMHDDGKMPILDLKVWVNETNVIKHEFYAKDVSSKSVIHRNSALPDTVKRTVLSQEALRRLLNCSRDLPWNEKAKHLTEFSLRLHFSGYDKRFR